VIDVTILHDTELREYLDRSMSGVRWTARPHTLFLRSSNTSH